MQIFRFLSFCSLFSAPYNNSAFTHRLLEGWSGGGLLLASYSRWFLLLIKTLLLDMGKIRYYLMKEYENNLLFEHVPVATAVCDATGNIKQANQAFRHWFNIQQPTQEPLSFKNYIRPQDRRQFHRFLQKLLTGGEPATCTATLIEPLSIPLRIEGRIIPPKDSDSPPLMILSLLSIEKEKRLEETLQSCRSALRHLRSILALLQTDRKSVV